MENREMLERGRQQLENKSAPTVQPAKHVLIQNSLRELRHAVDRLQTTVNNFNAKITGGIKEDIPQPDSEQADIPSLTMFEFLTNTEDYVREMEKRIHGIIEVVHQTESELF